MKSNAVAEGGMDTYAEEAMVAPGMPPSEPVQVVYNRTQKRVPVFRDDLVMYEQHMAQVMDDLRTLEMDVNALRVHYNDALQEKLYIESLAAQAEKRVQEVNTILDRYVGVRDAVVASDGFTYERETISSYIEGCKEAGGTPTSYQTDKPLTSLLIPNRSLKTLVDRLVSLQKAESTAPATAERGSAQQQQQQHTQHQQSHGKSMGGGRGAHAGGNQHDGPRRNMHSGGGGKESSGPVELNAKGERVHPCIRVYGFCNYNESCAYAKYPYDACLSNLKNKCRFKQQCHERHVEFRGPLDDYGNPLSANQGPSHDRATTVGTGESAAEANASKA